MKKEEKSLIEKIFPLVVSLRGYGKDALTGDLTAGLLTAVLLIPQGMAYAMIAGLPPVRGLYASVIPPFLYALFGTSRQMSVAPVAMVSLLVASSLGGLGVHSAELSSYAAILALMVGIGMLIMGFLKAGFVDNLLSRPVVIGFTAAAALIIGLSQLKHILGIRMGSHMSVFATIHEVFHSLWEVNFYTLAVGVASIVLIILLKKWDRRIPGGLIVVAGSILAVNHLGLVDRGVAVVGEIPAELPSFQIPDIGFTKIQALSGYALTIILVGFMESISVARAIAAKSRKKIDADQEFIALGFANTGGALFGGYPVAGGFSRTAVNFETGARTGLASIFTSVIIAVTLMFFTPYMQNLPKAALGGIIMVAVFGLIDLDEMKRIFKVKKSDGYLMVITMAVTLIIGIEEGVISGVLASLGYFMWKSMHPHTAVLGKVKGTEEVYRNVERFEVETSRNVGIIRFDASLYFANLAFFENQVLEVLHDNDDLRYIILDASGINDIDASAERSLRNLVNTLRENGTDFFIASAKGPVRDVLKASGFYAFLGDDRFFQTLPAAVEKAHEMTGEKQ